MTQDTNSLPPVEYWTTPAPPASENSHARCLGIEFMAFPNQDYRGDISTAPDYFVLVRSDYSYILDANDWRCQDFWTAVLCKSLYNSIAGQYIPLNGERFYGPTMRDDAFRWAAQQLLQRRQKQQEATDVPEAYDRP